MANSAQKPVRSGEKERQILPSAARPGDPAGTGSRLGNLVKLVLGVADRAGLRGFVIDRVAAHLADIDLALGQVLIGLDRGQGLFVQPVVDLFDGQCKLDENSAGTTPSALVSSRKGGYMARNSWPSPSTAACTFSAVVLTAPMARRWVRECKVSAAAAARKSLATWG
jgi:hypothetical protein